MKTIILTLILSAACSQINTESKQHYGENKSAHGLKVIETTEVYKPTIKIKTSKTLVAQGKKLYQENCLSCHGADGRGNGPDAINQKVAPTDLNRAVKEAEHFAFYTRYSYWDGRMPGWSKEFTDYELDAITAYLYEFKK